MAAVIIYLLIWYGPDLIARHDIGNVTGPLRILRLQQARDAALSQFHAFPHPVTSVQILPIPREIKTLDGMIVAASTTLLADSPWLWALASQSSDGVLPSGWAIARAHGRQERWGRLVKTAGLAGDFETEDTTAVTVAHQASS